MMDMNEVKKATPGEIFLSALMALTAICSIFVASKAQTPEFAFHAYLFSAASVLAIFIIVNRYYSLI